MRVKGLSMKGFRGIDQMTLEFDTDEPTVIIGINGVGKYSILDCISILLYWFTGRIQNISNSATVPETIALRAEEMRMV